MKKAKVLLLAACAVMVLGGCGSNQTKGELKNEFVSISQYKGVEIEKQEVKEITDEAVDEEINRRLEAKATSVDVTDRAVEKGDTANINYVGKKDGVAFDGGSADNHPLEIGSGAFIPGFEDGIIGHKIGETFDLPLKFPEGYKNADLAGKDVIFTVTINSIQAKSIPALDDAFVASVSETSKTVDEYKKEVKAELEEKLGVEELVYAAAAIPPGTDTLDGGAVKNVVEAAGYMITSLEDESTAANKVLRIQNGAVVDIGGGTTGISIFKDGKVVYVADEPTGGTHFSLVLSGAYRKTFEEAELFKRDGANHKEILPVLKPVIEKVSAIISRHIEGYQVDSISLVGGTCCLAGIEEIIEKNTRIPTYKPIDPMFVTPLGIAYSCTDKER